MGEKARDAEQNSDLYGIMRPVELHALSPAFPDQEGWGSIPASSVPGEKVTQDECHKARPSRPSASTGQSRRLIHSHISTL